MSESVYICYFDEGDQAAPEELRVRGFEVTYNDRLWAFMNSCEFDFEPIKINERIYVTSTYAEEFFKILQNFFWREKIRPDRTLRCCINIAGAAGYIPVRVQNALLASLPF